MSSFLGPQPHFSPTRPCTVSRLSPGDIPRLDRAVAEYVRDRPGVELQGALHELRAAIALTTPPPRRQLQVCAVCAEYGLVRAPHCAEPRPRLCARGTFAAWLVACKQPPPPPPPPSSMRKRPPSSPRALSPWLSATSSPASLALHAARPSPRRTELSQGHHLALSWRACLCASAGRRGPPRLRCPLMQHWASSPPLPQWSSRTRRRRQRRWCWARARRARSHRPRLHPRLRPLCCLRYRLRCHSRHFSSASCETASAGLPPGTARAPCLEHSRLRGGTLQLVFGVCWG